MPLWPPQEHSMRIALPILLIVAVGLGVWFFASSETGAEPAPASDATAQAGGTAEPDEVQSGAEGIDLPVESTANHAIYGVVFGPDDQPVAGATVTLYEVLSPWPRWNLRALETGYTGEGGEYRFETDSEMELLVEVIAEDYARSRNVVPPGVHDVTVRLENGFVVEGFVRGPWDKLSTDCEVFLEPGSWGQFEARATRTNDNGVFVFNNVPAGLARISARSRSHQPASAPMVTVGSDVQVRLRLSGVSHMTAGRVVEAATGYKPIAGAEVRVYPGSWNGLLFQPVVDVTDEEGRFKLFGLGDGNLRFEVHHPDYSVATRGLTIRRVNDDLLFELVPRARVRGRLIPVASGESVAGLALRIETVAGERSRTTVAADGTFEFDAGLSAGAATIEILGGERAFLESSSRLLDLTIEEDLLTEVERKVVAPSVVRGVVVDTGGNGVEEVVVSTPRYLRGGVEKIYALTDGEGVFEMRGLAPGVNDLRFEHGEFAVATRGVAVPPAGEIADLGEVALSAPGRLEGYVMRNGEPVAGATVFAAQPRASHVAATGRDGKFSVRSLAPGQYRVKVRYSTMPMESLAEPFEVVSGRSTRVPDVEIPGGRRVHGRVVEARNSRPIPDAFVFAPDRMGSWIRTDVFGRFTLEVGSDIESLIFYTPDLESHVTRPIRKGEDEMLVDLPLPRRGAIRARVLGPDRKPVTSGVIRVDFLESGVPGEPSRDIESRVVEMTGGLLMADGIPVGAGKLTLQCQGFAPYVTDIKLDSPRETLDLDRIVLEPGAQVHGRVVDGDGMPVPAAMVFVGLQADVFQSRFRPQTTTDREGRFTVGGIAAHSSRIVVQSDQYAIATAAVSVADLLRGADDPLTIKLQRRSTITVRVFDAGGELTEDRIVLLRRGAAVVGDDLPDPSGKVRFVTPGPGRYRVLIFGEEAEAVVEVGEEPKNYTVDLRSTR